MGQPSRARRNPLLSFRQADLGVRGENHSQASRTDGKRAVGVDRKRVAVNNFSLATAAIDNSFVDELVKEKIIEKAFGEKPR